VAEAAALLAAGPDSRLLQEKRIERAQGDERGAATIAIGCAAQQWAPQRGQLHLVGLCQRRRLPRYRRPSHRRRDTT